MRRGVPDRVPVWCQLSEGHIGAHGLANGRTPRNGEEGIVANCSLTKRYRFDALFLDSAGLRADKAPNGRDLNSMGLRWYDAGQRYEGDLEAIDPDRWPQEPWTWTADDFYGCRVARDIMGDGMHIGGWTPDAYSRAVNWFAVKGMSEAMLGMVADPERFEAIVNWFRPRVIAYALAQIRYGGVESICISCPYAGSSFISKAYYRRFVLPSIVDLAQALKSLGVFSYVHNCGFIGDRLETIADSGVDGIECMDPPPLGDVELADAKRRVGHRIFLRGNLDSVNILWRADEDTFVRNVRATIEAGKPGGGYILGSACSVAPEAPPERMERLVDMAEQWGVYALGTEGGK
jgi:hypothetical protein